MSKSSKLQKNFNSFLKTNLSNQQKIVVENYEKLQNGSKYGNLISYKNTNDYHYETLYNINNTSNELPQYSSLYLKRLELTKKRLLEDCRIKWPKITVCKNILDLKGTVIKYFYNIYFIYNHKDYL